MSRPHAGSTEILDLCSGGAGLAGQAAPRVRLTDKYPNVVAFAQASAASGGRLDFVAESVDATAVPATLTGVRTLLSSFHHFPPEGARAILRDAAVKGAPIGVFVAVTYLLGLPARADESGPPATPVAADGERAG